MFVELESEKEEKMRSSVAFIKATSNEQFMFWQQNKDIYVQDCLGFSQLITLIDSDKNKPVRVSFSFAHILGKRICFFETISRYDDKEAVRAWLEKNYPIKHGVLKSNGILESRDFDVVIHKINENKI